MNVVHMILGPGAAFCGSQSFVAQYRVAQGGHLPRVQGSDASRLRTARAHDPAAPAPDRTPAKGIAPASLPLLTNRPHRSGPVDGAMVKQKPTT